MQKRSTVILSIGVVVLLFLGPGLQAIPLNLPPLIPQASAQGGISTIHISNVKTNSGTLTSSFQIKITNFNASAGSSRILVVAVEANNKAASSVTYTVGSETFNLSKAAGSFYNDYNAIWYLKNPMGTGNVTVTMAGSTSVVVGAYAVYNVDQANPIPNTATNYTSTTPVNKNPHITLTTEYPDSLILDSVSTFGGSTLSGMGCGTQEWNIKVSSTTITGASSNTTRASAGTVTCNWTSSATNAWDDAAIEIKASGAAPEASPIVLNSRGTMSGVVNSPYQATMFNFTTGAGPSKLLLVGISANNQSVSSVTFGGTSLTKAISHFTNNDAEFWYLKNPSNTPGNIVVTFGGSTAFAVGAYSFFGVNQTKPIPTNATNNGTSGNPTVSLTTTANNDLVFDQPSIFGGSALSSPTCLQKWESSAPITSTSKITGASSVTLVPVSGTKVTCKWTNSISTNQWDDVAVEVKATSLPSTTGVLIPLYDGPYTQFPCSSHNCFAWNAVNATKTKYPNVPIFDIVNVNSGPCYSNCTSIGGNPNTQFQYGIKNLTSQGVIVLGYVSTNYTNHNRPYSVPKGNITQWSNWYGPNSTIKSLGVQGIFFDEMNYSNTGVALDYYQNLTNYAKSLGFTYTFGNPGTSTLSPYLNSGSAGTIVINETEMDSKHHPPIISDLQSGTFSSSSNNLGYDKHNFSFLIYNQTASTGLPSPATIGNQSNYVGLMYYSNTTSCCPFDVWFKTPPYLSSLAGNLSKSTSVITINSTGPSGPVTGLFVQTSQNGTTVPSGYTPYSYLGTQGVTYTFTPQSSSSCTFHNWIGGYPTQARAVTVTTSSQVFTANYTGTNCK